MSNELPLVCICIPTYNVAATVIETLESILKQTYPNLVVHVSDNASTDDTIKLIESIKDPRVTIHRHVENIGAEGNFNRCIQIAEGKYTAIFHADDIYEPNMVAKQVAFMEANSESAAVFTAGKLIDQSGNIFGNISLPRELSSENRLYDFPTVFKAVMRHGNFFICPSFLVRTQVYKQDIKEWRGDLFGSSADLYVWLRILQLYPIGYIQERLIKYRICNTQFSSQLRLNTDQAPFFKTIDYYLQQDEVKAILNTSNHLDYKRYERRDRVVRATNLFLMDRSHAAVHLLSDIYSIDTLNAALKSKRGLMTLIVGVFIRLLIRTRLNKSGKYVIGYLRKLTYR